MPLLPSVTGSSCASCPLIHQRPQMGQSTDAGPNNQEQYHLSIFGREDKCIAFFPAHLSPLFIPLLRRSPLLILMWSGWSSWWWHGVDYAVPTVTYSKAARGRHHCCLWSVDDSPACCTSSTLASSWWEGSTACVQGRVEDMPWCDRYGLLKQNTGTGTFGVSPLMISAFVPI